MPKMIKALCIGLLCGLAALLGVCVVMSVVQLLADIPDRLLLSLSAALPGTAAYVSAYSSTQFFRSKGLMQGLICGCAVFALTLFFSAVTGNFAYTNMTEIKAAVCLICGAVGGIKGINTKKTKLGFSDRKRQRSNTF